MTISFSSPVSALKYNASINIAALGGNAPYQYSLGPNGPGGILTTLQDGSVTYTAPSFFDSDDCVETIIATDANQDTAAVEIIVGNYLTILCDIIAHELNIPGRVFLANQKVDWPKDNRMFISVATLTDLPMGNITNYRTSGDNFSEIKSVPSASITSVHMYSRGREAEYRRFEVLSALASTYSQQQQMRNGIRIAQIPAGRSMNNLSEEDGDAILTHYHFDIVVNNTNTLIAPVDYFDKYQVTETTNA